MLERLQDFEDKVRSRAIIAICEAAMTFPEVSLTGTHMSLTGTRLMGLKTSASRTAKKEKSARLGVIIGASVPKSSPRLLLRQQAGKLTLRGVSPLSLNVITAGAAADSGTCHDDALDLS